ncbi:MAG: hypothetical protein M3R00_10785 [Pseudomonadota bacterium]|nr:hypothetical protein [Pseudomonadota bacterium]
MNISKYLLTIAFLSFVFAANAQNETTTTITVPAGDSMPSNQSSTTTSTTITTPAPAPVVVAPGSATTTTSVTTPLKVDANCVCKDNEDTGFVVIAGATVDPDAPKVPCRCEVVRVITPVPAP